MTESIIFAGVLVVIILGIFSQVGYFRVMTKDIFGWRREKKEQGCSDAPQSGECFKRRSLTEKSRPLLWYGLLCVVIWVVATGALVTLLIHSSIIFFIGVPVTFVAIIVFHFRLSTRYLLKLIETTPCPGCGNFPMEYINCSADKRRLLVCRKCRTEWDLGPAAS